MKVLKYIILLSFFLPLKSIGQAPLSIFSEEQLIWFIENYHPISQQGDLLVNKGESTLKRA